MKKLLSLTVAIILGIGAMFANPVDVTTAKTIGQKFVQTNFEQTRGSNLELIKTYAARTGETSFYVFSVGEKGFVIVSADDNYRPIVGYSYDDNFNVDNRECNFYLNAIANGRVVFRSNGQDPKVAEEWESVRNYGRLLKYNNGRGGDEYLCQTIWNQNPAPYNSMCPADPQGPGGHAYVGCVATAMAQIMKFWNYPEVGQGSHTYYCNANPYAGYAGHPEYGPQTANFGETHYDWEHMLNSYNGSYTPEEGDAVATLSYHCGVSVDMMYGNSTPQDNGSGAYSGDVPNAIKQYFLYSNAATMRNYSNLDSWKTILKEQLDLGWPIYHSGSSSEGGHAFVCDGYNDEDLFHYNWGWGGSMGWFVANEIEYSNNMAVIINFVPTPVYNNASQAPTNVTAVKTSDTAQEATITWTNPTKTLGNQNITSIDHMVVERNGVIIYISEATTPGATMSFVDNNVPCYSTFEYRVYAVCNDARGKYAATTESFGPTCSWKIIGTTTSMTGWKGGAIVSYDGAGSKIDECTMTNNNPMTYNMNITLGKAVFMWKAGTDNVALTIKIKDPAGNVVYQYDGNSNDLPEGVILETNNGCGNAAPTEVPGELFTSEDGENIILTWSGSSKTMYGYNIYRDGYLIELAHDTEFVDVAPSMGGHCYQVCYLTDGGESVLSNEACATAGEGCDAPTNIWYQVQNNYKPLITWDPAPNMTPDDAYVVYRKTGDDGEYTLIKYVSGKTEYKENKALTDGTWYYYRVMASYNDSGCESAPAKSKYANEYYVKYYYSTDGVEEIVAQNVNVYPNPTKDILTVEAVNLSNVVIYNSLGQRVFAQTFDGNEAKIDMSSFDAGIYMVRISADGNEVTKKISVVK